MHRGLLWADMNAATHRGCGGALAFAQAWLEELLPPDAHTRCRGRVHVRLKRVRFLALETVVVSDFTTRTATQMPAAAPCGAVLPFPRVKLHTRGNI